LYGGLELLHFFSILLTLYSSHAYSLKTPMLVITCGHVLIISQIFYYVYQLTSIHFSCNRMSGRWWLAFVSRTQSITLTVQTIVLQKFLSFIGLHTLYIMYYRLIVYSTLHTSLIYSQSTICFLVKSVKQKQSLTIWYFRYT
jgi:hypothetical protein